MKFIAAIRRVKIFAMIMISHYQSASQELEPRVYANLPKGINAIEFAYAFSKGNVLTDPSLPIEGFKVTAHNLGAGYVRTFDLAGKLARIQINLPFVFIGGSLKLNGRDTTGARTGFGDMRIRFGINLFGSPALEKTEFRKYQQKMIVGFSLVTSIPTGFYYKDKRINIGSNRWGFKPEIGISKRFHHVYAEAYAGVWFFTENKEFLETKKLKQDPVYSFQAHLSYYFRNRMWIGANGNWFTGGRTLVNSLPSAVIEDNWRIGAIWSVPFNASHSIKIQFHTGAATNKGYDYNIIVLAYQYVFF